MGHLNYLPHSPDRLLGTNLRLHGKKPLRMPGVNQRENIQKLKLSANKIFVKLF